MTDEMTLAYRRDYENKRLIDDAVAALDLVRPIFKGKRLAVHIAEATDMLEEESARIVRVWD